MALQAIINKIIQDARGEAEKITSQAKKQAQELKEEKRQRIGQITASAERQAKIKSVEEKNKVLSAAKLQQRQDLLAEKQELIEETFRKALEEINKMQTGEYRKFIKRLLFKAVEDGDEKVIISQGEKRITQKLLEEVNSKLKENGKRGELKLSPERRKMQGGFVLQKGRFEINCSLEESFASVREELASEVAKELFGE